MMHSVEPQYSPSGNDDMEIEEDTNAIRQHTANWNGHSNDTDEAYLAQIERYLANTHLQDTDILFEDAPSPGHENVTNPERNMPKARTFAYNGIDQEPVVSRDDTSNDGDNEDNERDIYNDSLDGRDPGTNTQNEESPPTASSYAESVSSECMVYSGVDSNYPSVCDTVHVPCLQSKKDALVIGNLSQQGQLVWAGLPPEAGPLQLVFPTEKRPYAALRRLITQYGQGIYEGLPRLLAAAEAQRNICQWNLCGVERPSHRRDVVDMMRSLRDLHSAARAAVQSILHSSAFQRSPLTPLPHRRHNDEQTIRDMIHEEVLRMLDKQMQAARESAVVVSRRAGGAMVEAGMYVAGRMGAAAAMAAEHTPWAIQTRRRIYGRLQNQRVVMREDADENGNDLVMVDQLEERDEPIFLEESQDWEML